VHQVTDGNRDRRQGRSPLLAALASALLPGTGQWLRGRRGRGAAFLAPLLVAGVVAVAVLRRGPLALAILAVQPAVLRGLLLADGLLLLWRLLAAVDAYRLPPRRRESPTTWRALAVLGAAVLVLLPHLLVGSYLVRGIDLLETVFVTTTTVVAAPTPPSSSVPPAVEPVSVPPVTAAPAPPHRNLLFRPGVGDPAAVAVFPDIVAPPPPEAPFLPFAERVDPHRLTVLLVGGDRGPGRRGLRTDTMIVATLDVDTGEAALFGIPRNFKMVPLPRSLRRSFLDLERRTREDLQIDADGAGHPDWWQDLDGDGVPEEPPLVSCGCFPEMLNRVHQETETWHRRFPDAPDPGLEALRRVVQHLLDLHIDYAVMVDMAGFVRAIDAIGGVDVLVTDPLHVAVSAPWEGAPKARVSVEPGVRHLDGLEALAYVRWRRGQSDYVRMRRQRCLVRAAAAQADPFTLLRNFPRLATVVEESVVTDLPLTFLPELLRILGRVDFDHIATVGFVPPTYISGRTPGRYPIPNVSRIRAKVRSVLAEGAAAQGRDGTSECGR